MCFYRGSELIYTGYSNKETRITVYRLVYIVAHLKIRAARKDFII